jgi:hypothetical protein
MKKKKALVNENTIINEPIEHCYCYKETPCSLNRGRSQNIPEATGTSKFVSQRLCRVDIIQQLLTAALKFPIVRPVCRGESGVVKFK